MKNLSLLSTLCAFWLSIAPVFATTIAFDGKHFAADRQITITSPDGVPIIKYFCPGKIYYSKIYHAYIGLAGETKVCAQFAAFFCNDTPLPKSFKDDFHALIVYANGRCFLMQGIHLITEVTAPTAIGSGTKVAVAAMMSGKTAKQAVFLCEQLDFYTGGHVDSFTVVQPSAPPRKPQPKPHKTPVYTRCCCCCRH
jgi:hypothetical protein